MFVNQRNLLIAPHQDDEILAAYGLMLLSPTDWTVLFITDGAKGLSVNHLWMNKRIAEIRKIESKYNLMMIGVFDFKFADFEQDRLIDNAWRVSECLTRVGEYDNVFTPHPQDGHEDHRFVSDLTTIACGSFKVAKPNLYYYTINTGIGESLLPADIEYVLPENVYETKKKAIVNFKSQDHFLVSVFNRPYYHSEKFWRGK